MMMITVCRQSEGTGGEVWSGETRDQSEEDRASATVVNGATH